MGARGPPHRLGEQWKTRVECPSERQQSNRVCRLPSNDWHHDSILQARQKELMNYSPNSMVALTAALLSSGLLAGCQGKRPRADNSRTSTALQSTNPDSAGFVPDCNRGVAGLICYVDTTFTQTFPGEP